MRTYELLYQTTLLVPRSLRHQPVNHIRRLTSSWYAARSRIASKADQVTQRRSKDGFVSATGMFKIAFPWAQHSEEKEERDYLKTLDSTSEDDVAGNIWVTPEFGMIVMHGLGDSY